MRVIIVVASYTDYSNYHYCGYGQECLYSDNDVSTLYNTTLVLDDYKRRITESQRKQIVNRLRQIGFLKDNEGWEEYHRYVIRLFFYPKHSLVKEIQQERQRIGLSSNQIGVHLRCGGFLADVNEDTAMITPELLKTVPDRMKGLMNRSSLNENNSYFYLSTDSSLAAKLISDALQPIPIKTTNLYHRGHTSLGLGDDTTIKRALVELHLVSQSRSLLLTSASTFSQIVKWMSDSSQIDVIDAPYTHTNATWGKRIA